MHPLGLSSRSERILTMDPGLVLFVLATLTLLFMYYFYQPAVSRNSRLCAYNYTAADAGREGPKGPGGAVAASDSEHGQCQAGGHQGVLHIVFLHLRG